MGKKRVIKCNQEFEILIESEKDGAHFALLESTGNFKSTDLHLEEKQDYRLNDPGIYYLMWGATEDPHYVTHGISPLYHHTGRKWPLKKAMAEFFKAVKNSEHQSFHFRDAH